jgi:protocatechuate 3,4-dioxygenase beta subunit
MRKVVIWSSVVLLIAAASSPATSQKNEGSQLRTLTGHVLSSQNQPLGKAIVYLKNTKTLMIKTYITDADGSYRFPALSPVVDYEVFAESQGAHSDTKTLSAFDNRKQINITLRIRAK